MFSQDKFLDIAAKAENTYLDLCAKFPPGTISKERSEARSQMEQAMACATWMSENGFDTLKNVGPFETFVAKKGDKVRIRKGSVIYSTDPSVPQEGIVSAKDHVVIAKMVSGGYLDYRDSSNNPKVIQGRVQWSGSGSYWRWTDINNVEIVA